jgi:hypothetical protein
MVGPVEYLMGLVAEDPMVRAILFAIVITLSLAVLMEVWSKRKERRRDAQFFTPPKSYRTSGATRRRSTIYVRSGPRR